MRAKCKRATPCSQHVAKGADQIGKARGLERKAARLRVEKLRHAVDDNGDDRQKEGPDILPEVQGDHLVNIGMEPVYTASRLGTRNIVIKM